MTDREALAARIEAATGLDRELDCEIGVALGWFITQPNKGWPDRLDYVDVRDPERILCPGNGFAQLVPRFTASIDAAARLFDNDAWLMIALNNASRFCESRDQIPRHLAAAAIRAGGV